MHSLSYASLVVAATAALVAAAPAGSSSSTSKAASTKQSSTTAAAATPSVSTSQAAVTPTPSTKSTATSTSAPAGGTSTSFGKGQPEPQLLKDNPDDFYYPDLKAQDGISTSQLPPSNETHTADGSWLGTSLFGFNECKKRGLNKARINDAYYDMYYLTNTDGIYKDIDWNTAAALEYLGPPANNKDSQKSIQNYLFQASQTTYNWYAPPYTKHYIHVRCDDPDSRCTKCDKNGKQVESDVTAYADNDDGNGYSQISFCPRFFRMRRLQNAAIDYGKGFNDQRKYDARKYDNSARVFLHELMHLDYFMGLAQFAPEHIGDMSVDFAGTEARVYGPLMTKVLARFNDPSGGNHPTGWYVARNADNMAWFAVARYVQNKLNDVYPHLPLVGRGPDAGSSPWFTIGGDGLGLLFSGGNGTKGGAVSIKNNGTFPANVTSLTSYSSCSTDIKNAPAEKTLRINGMSGDSLYPADYIKSLNGWIKDLQSS